jgi:FkbM family methyltransferase
MHVSYAQRLEDYHLARVFEGWPAGTYVDVGGGHPVADNVTFHFYLAGWRGLVVEPQAHLADLYPHIRPRDVIAKTLVGRTVGEIEFFEVAGLHGFSTSVAEHAQSAKALGAAVKPVRRPITTLSALCRASGISSIDVLKVDVEGAEADVLAGHDWQALRPKVVVVEAVAPGSMKPAWESWEPDLIAKGYRFAFFDELNRFYVADEVAELASRFPASAAAWDVAEHPFDYGRALDKPGHPDRALATALANGLMAISATLEPALLARLIEAGGGFAGTADEVRRRLLGHVPVMGDPTGTGAELLDSDAVRAALGRIAAHYDGGFIGE